MHSYSQCENQVVSKREYIEEPFSWMHRVSALPHHPQSTNFPSDEWGRAA